MSETKSKLQILWDFLKEKGFEFVKNQYIKNIDGWIVNYSCGYRVLTIYPVNPIANDFDGKTNIRCVETIQQVQNALAIYDIKI